MRRAANLIAASAVASLAAAGCAASASPESGVTAFMRVSNAQFVEGALAPDTSATGSAVISGVAINNTNVYPGEQNFPLSGTVTGATALVGLEDDVGYWIVPATLIDQTTVGGYDFSTQLTFSPLMPVGSQTLILRGVAKDGTIGPAQLYKLAAAAIVPTGAMVITLAWDTEVDLDLHVVIPSADPNDPTPIEIWAKHPIGLPVAVLGGPPIYPDQIAAAPYLDFDSNANCAIDGRRQENVVFPAAPPAGDYSVRVDTPSLCGLSNAQWTASTTLPDGTTPSAQWESTDASTRGPHGPGAGLLAFDFTIQTPTQ